MSPGQPRTFTPPRPGVYTLLCDVHSHMRGYLIVADTPWVRVCSREGTVPLRRRSRRPLHPEGLARDGHAAPQGGDRRRGRAGRSGDARLDVPAALVAAHRRSGAGAALVAGDREDRPAAGIESRCGGAGPAASRRPGSWRRTPTGASSRRRTWRRPSGSTSASPAPGRSRTSSARWSPASVTSPRVVEAPEHATELSRKLLLGLLSAAAELNRKGVTDEAHVLAGTDARATATASATAATVVDAAAAAPRAGCTEARVRAGRGAGRPG